MLRSLLRVLNGIVTFAVAVSLLIAGLYAGFALWDNGQIYAAAEDAFAEMREIRTAMDTEAANDTQQKGQDSQELNHLEQLQMINPDVTAWITMEGTAIDYPVMQGKTNYTYINSDPYGTFALAGSIFLDFRNDREYKDIYSLLYGHDMSEHRMFSDVNLYKEEKFFNEHHEGTLLLPDGAHRLLSISCIVTFSGNSSIFNPMNWNYLDADGILEIAQENAMFVNPDGLQALQIQLEDEEMMPHVVALSTCSSEFTDARTILLTLMDPPEDVSDNE